MKRLILLLAICSCSFTFSQTPQQMSYQAVIRNVSNTLMTNTMVGMRISILQGSPGGTAVYVETQNPTTNANGLVSLAIGTGTVTTGSFSTINWAAGVYFIKTETDPAGGTNYTIIGNSQILSVPYALYADKANALSSTQQDVFEVYSTGQLQVTSSTTSFILIPGLTQVVTIPAGSKAYVHTDGGLQCTAAGNAYSVVDVSLFVDNAQSPTAGSRRVVAANTTGIGNMVANWSFGKTYSLATGSHTFEVRAMYPAGTGASTANVSSGTAALIQGVLTVTIIKQ